MQRGMGGGHGAAQGEEKGVPGKGPTPPKASGRDVHIPSYIVDFHATDVAFYLGIRSAHFPRYLYSRGHLVVGPSSDEVAQNLFILKRCPDILHR